MIWNNRGCSTDRLLSASLVRLLGTEGPCFLCFDEGVFDGFYLFIWIGYAGMIFHIVFFNIDLYTYRIIWLFQLSIFQFWNHHFENPCLGKNICTLLTNYIFPHVDNNWKTQNICWGTDKFQKFDFSQVWIKYMKIGQKYFFFYGDMCLEMLLS